MIRKSIGESNPFAQAQGSPIHTPKRTSTNIPLRSQLAISEISRMPNGEKRESVKPKGGIFEKYQMRQKINNRKLFRYLITWRLGVDGKIEDQLRLMITYLSIIFVAIIFICGAGTSYYFHITNKDNIKTSIETQAQSIISKSLVQYKNSTEYIFKGYEFVLNYLSEIILSKLQISHLSYDYNNIKAFPYKGPNMMRDCWTDESKCTLYTGDVVFTGSPVSLKCMDFCEFDSTTVPLVDESVYQTIIDEPTLTSAVDVLNYVLESQMFDIFITKMYQIYFGFESRQSLYIFPGYSADGIPKAFRPHTRSWYLNTRTFHVETASTATYRVISTPYYDAGTNGRIVTISKAILAPNKLDTSKRYLKGKGEFLGVASVDIKITEFQQLFADLTFYDTGYLALVANNGKLLNEPAQFIVQTQLAGTTYMDVSLDILLNEEDWKKIFSTTEEQLIQIVESKFGQSLVVSSTLNKDNFYSGQEIAVVLIIPYDEVYGEIDKQNNENLTNILIACGISFGVFIIATIICMIFVKKKIVSMVSAISELNKCALSLSVDDSSSNNSNNNNNNNNAPIAQQSKEDGQIQQMNIADVKTTNPKKEVMQKLKQIQQNTESQTIKELVHGFENQLKGISKLGKGGQNMLKNGRTSLKYDFSENGGTHIKDYAAPLLKYIDDSLDTNDTEPFPHLIEGEIQKRLLSKFTNREE